MAPQILRPNRQRAFRLAVTFSVALLALLALFGLAAAQSDGAAIVRADPAALSLTTGQTATVSFAVEDIANLYGADVRAKFDPAALEVVDADEGKPDTQIVPGAFLKPDFVVRAIADNAAGTIWYANTQVSPTLPVSGSGVLFTAVFRAKSDVTDSPITLTYAKMVERTGASLSVTMAGAAPEPSAPTAAPTALATLLAPTEAPAAPGAATAAPAIVAPTAPATGARESGPTTAAASGMPPLCAPPGLLLLPLGVVVAVPIALLALRRIRRP